MEEEGYAQKATVTVTHGPTLSVQDGLQLGVQGLIGASKQVKRVAAHREREGILGSVRAGGGQAEVGKGLLGQVQAMLGTW